MKLTTGIVALAMTAGMAWAQNPASIIQNTKSSLQGAQQQKSAAVNSALQATGTPGKPSPATASNHPASAPAPAKPAAAPAAPAQTVKVVQTKTAPAPAKVAPVAAVTPVALGVIVDPTFVPPL